MVGCGEDWRASKRKSVCMNEKPWTKGLNKIIPCVSFHDCLPD